MIDAAPAFAVILLAIPGIALLIVMRLIFGSRPGSRTGSMRLQFSLLGWISIWLAVIGAVVGICGLTPTLLLLLMGGAVVGLMVWINVQRAEHRALVGAVAAGIERGVAAPEMARAFAGEISGGTGVRALKLATLLESGMPLDAAVTRARLWLGTGVQVAIRTGCALGVLGPAVLRELKIGREMEEVARPLAPRLWYLGWVVNFGLAILTFVMLKIVPVFDRMFDEFELPLPAPTVMLIRWARFAADAGPLSVALLGMLVAAMVLPTLVYMGVLSRNLPLLDRLLPGYDGAIVLRSLALAVRRSVPLGAGLRLVGTAYPLRSVRRWLLAAAERVEAGMPGVGSLLATGLIGRSDAAVLQSAERAGNLAWAMEEVSDSLLRREVYRWRWWYSVLSPLVMLMFGLVVGLIVVALFLPIIALIQGMSR